MRFLFAILFSLSLAFAQDVELDEFESEYSKSKVFDPLSGYNRFMTGFNDIFYSYLVTPVARGYDWVMPDPIQGAFSDFFDNLMYPVRLVNNLLQGKFENSWDETKRFLINTTIGFAGLSDAATMHFNVPRHDEDFGQTLGYWGVGSGFHIVWPFLGPSNLRDSFGLVGDFFASPINQIDDQYTKAGINIFSKFNEFSLDPDQYEELKRGTVDLYPFLRDTYEQRREYLIKE